MSSRILYAAPVTCLAACIVLTISAAVRAADSPPPAKPAAATEAQPKAEIVAVAPQSAGLSERITVKVVNFPKNLHHQAEWVLYLDGLPLKGLLLENGDFEEEVVDADLKKKVARLTFTLRRDEHCLDSWKTLLRGWAYERPVGVSLGTETAIEPSIARLSKGFNLVVVPRDFRLFASVAIVLGALISLVLLGQKTNLLKELPIQFKDDGEPGKEPEANGPKTKGGERRYSLAKVQWAFWLILILSAYLAIGLVTWDYYNIFSTTALALLGISTTTALGSVMIDSTTINSKKETLHKTEQENASIKLDLDAPNATNKGMLQLQLLRGDQEVKRLTKALQPTCRGFILDILGDEHGISMYRFQIVVWTIVLGFVFFVGVLNDKTMPDFSPTLLALMGVSGGTFLAFKVPESRS